MSEDIDTLKKMPTGLPHLYFFRHVKGVSGVACGQKFGEKYLYKWWKKACYNLGIDGVDLYGGTRHSTTTDLAKYFSPEHIKKYGTAHSTNKAFDRYLHLSNKESKKIFETIIQNRKKLGKETTLAQKNG